MVVVTVDGITKSYGDRQVLDQLSLTIEDQDKIGIIGVNGSGKSTLLKILCGLEDPDSGTLMVGKDVKIAYLPQIPPLGGDVTIWEQVLEMVTGETPSLAYEVKKVLNILGLPDTDVPVATLSGGEKKKISLAVTLLIPCDLLLLDEPTNHLDMDAVLWLEEYLRQFRGAVAMITHDRYFLDRVVNRITEIRSGKLYSYNCNFAQYLELKSAEEDSLAATERKSKSLYRKELEWIQRGARARGTKSKERIARFHDLADRDQPEDGPKLELSSVSTRLGRTIIELDHLSKGYGEQPLIADFSYIFLRDARVGIIGPNGAGKTTLFKLMTGEIPPDSGEILTGQTVKIGYYSQEQDDLATKQQLRVIDYIKEEAEIIVTKEGTITATQMLDRFLFSSDLQYNRVGRLSGGEQKRLFLLKLLMGAPNVLLLDEPTNDLDIVTLQILEDYLESFDGAVVVISHDRYFLDKVVDTIFAFEAEGTLTQYAGNYSDYLDQRPEKSQISTGPKKEPTKKENPAPRKERSARFSFKEQYDFDHIDEEIALLEEQLATTNDQITAQAANYTKLEQLLEEKSEQEAELADRMSRWVYLQELAEKIQQQQEDK